MNHLWISLKYRLWFRRTGVGDSAFLITSQGMATLLTLEPYFAQQGRRNSFSRVVRDWVYVVNSLLWDIWCFYFLGIHYLPAWLLCVLNNCQTSILLVISCGCWCWSTFLFPGTISASDVLCIYYFLYKDIEIRTFIYFISKLSERNVKDFEIGKKYT